jgi:formylglycine-generating enzyme required for sulfatase activity
VRKSAIQAFVIIVTAAGQTPVDFVQNVKPVLEQNCISCHATKLGANIPAFASRQALIDAKMLIPGKAEESRIYQVLLRAEGTPGAMPPSGARIANRDIRTIQRWINAGANWPEGATLSRPAVDHTSDAAEQTAVRRIREKILAHAQGAASTPYRVTIPETTVSYGMVPIPAGAFEMGSPGPENPDEQPQHKVRVDAFWMQEHEVTWDEYRLFMFSAQAKDDLVDAVSRPTRPYVEMSFGMGINGYPAISMTQHAANKYAEWLSARIGEFYRLPTEAEWEYACRAGTSTAYFFGGDAARLGDYAWYSENAGGKYQKVATRKPNPWGLYDMLGNAMEWTLDQYAAYAPGEAANPRVESKAPYPHSVRGGSWKDPATACRCASRVPSSASWKRQDPQLPKSIWYHTDAQWLGFRLVRPAKIPSAEEMYKAWNNGVEHDEK